MPPPTEGKWMLNLGCLRETALRSGSLPPREAEGVGRPGSPLECGVPQGLVGWCSSPRREEEGPPAALLPPALPPFPVVSV